MPIVIEKPHLLRRLAHVFRGYDSQLALAVMALALAGLITMYSSGFANGTRFWDHLRNLSLAFVIMVVVAQIPPQRLMTFAVPLYTLGVGDAEFATFQSKISRIELQLR